MVEAPEAGPVVPGAQKRPEKKAPETRTPGADIGEKSAESSRPAPAAPSNGLAEVAQSMNPLPVPGPAPAKGVDVNLTAHKDSLQADTTRIAALPGKPGTLVKKEAKKLSPDGKTTPQEGQTEIQGLLHLGEVLGDRGEYDTAEIAYWQILNRPQLTVPDEKSALLGLAHMLRKKGDPPALTKAAAIYEKYVKEFSDDEQVPRALLELGRTLRDMGVYKVAINRFYSVINSTLKFSPQDFAQYEMLAKTAQFEIAQTYFDAGDFVEAGKFFGRVRLLDLAPQDQARAQFMAAESEQLAGHLDAAVMLLKTYLSTAPDDANVPEARYLLATTLRQLKRHQEALEVTLELLRAEHSKNEADPKSWLNWQRRAGNQIANDLFQDGDSRNALAIYKGLLELASDPAWRLSVTYQIAPRRLPRRRKWRPWPLGGLLTCSGRIRSRANSTPFSRTARRALPQTPHSRRNRPRRVGRLSGPRRSTLTNLHEAPGSASAAHPNLRRTVHAGA
jgi:tetratricopeptide (TPR) repeat protein